jgi:alpha-1,6-mannosyltransferase
MARREQGAGWLPKSLSTIVTRPHAPWIIGGGALIGAALLLTWISPRFAYDIDLIDKPVLWVAAGLVAAGLIYAAAVPDLIERTLNRRDTSGAMALGIILSAGLLVRLILFASEPVLEDDFYRYLWDGAVTAGGSNPYAIAPADAAASPNLSPDAARVLDRVGHADLRTIYPAAAQAAFAAAHLLAPWSLTAWRSIVLLLDGATLALLLLLLKDAGRSPVWSALYWWNPLVIFSLANGAHMDIVVLPPLLLALLLAARGRTVFATAALAVAVGAKIWPVLLLPLVLRPALKSPARLIAATSVLVALIALQAWPILASGIDQSSGFVAYAQSWQRNSALFPAVETMASWIAGSDLAGTVSRGALALLCGAVALAVAWRPYTTTTQLMTRAALVVATLLLTAPAQYPWYLVWLAPFLAFLPVPGMLLLTATLPLYYTAFYFAPRQQIAIYNGLIVWLAWLPVWALLARDLWRLRRAGSDEPLPS